MYCCKCHKKYDSFHASSWVKLQYSTMSNVKTVPAIYNSGTVTSEPYYLLCPWCFEHMFENCKPRVDKWDKSSVECSKPSITTYTEVEPIIKAKDWMQDIAYINSNSYGEQNNIITTC